MSMSKAKPPRAPEPADLNGSGMGLIAAAPWYVKLVLWLLAWFGFPVGLSVFLLMLIVGYVPSPLTDLKAEMKEHRGEMGDQKKDMQQIIQYTKVSERVWRQICRNTSPSVVERVECDR